MIYLIVQSHWMFSYDPMLSTREITNWTLLDALDGWLVQSLVVFFWQQRDGNI